MVFAANGGLVVDGIAIGAHFRHWQRQGESVPYVAALERLGFSGATIPERVNEGEGDFLLVGDSGTITVHRMREVPLRARGIDEGMLRFDTSRVIAFTRR